MSICKKDVANPKIRSQVVKLYCETALTMIEVGKKIGVSNHTVSQILKEEIKANKLEDIKASKYALSKLGDKNPCYGRRSPNYIGDCSDCKGYLTRVVDRKRYFSHRDVFSGMLDIHVRDLPSELVVHHIDRNSLNNHPDNLALCTKVGHRQIHARYAKDNQELGRTKPRKTTENRRR